MENVKRLAKFQNRTLIAERRTVEAPRVFSRFEEVSHSITHGAGAVAGIFGLILLLIRASASDTLSIIGAAVFGASLIVLYSASSIYHTTCAIYGSVSPSRIRDFCQKCDHSLIYVLIIGTYTPACISALGNTLGFIILGIVLAISVVGIILNVINVKKFQKVSLLLYVVSGWMISVAIKPFFSVIGVGGTVLLVLGGVAYTVGIFFFNATRTKYMHLVWHFFVLLGSILHFLMIYFYCI